MLIILACLASSLPAAALKFEPPVLVGQGNGSHEHYWFPEDGAYFNKTVVANVRFTMDGSGTQPPLTHHMETLVSWNGGESFEHLSFDAAIPGTPTHVVDDQLVGYGNFHRMDDNKSFYGFRFTYSSDGKRVTRVVNTTKVSFTGFPFPVSRFTYASKIVTLRGEPNRLVHLMAYSHKANEKGGADENLAAFGSVDTGASWRFLAVVASRNATLAQRKWEGPGEDDLVQLRDGRLLAVFRVESMKPYWKAYSGDGGVTWSDPIALPFGSVRPKLIVVQETGAVLLSGGRPGLFIWTGDPGAESWVATDVAAVHNSLAQDPSWHYPQCYPDCPSGSTSYTTLSALGDDRFLLQYDRLANGWKMPPGLWGDRDRTFAMQFSV